MGSPVTPDGGEEFGGEALFREVFTTAADGIGVADAHGRVVEVNRSFADMLGYRVAELRAADIRTLFHPDDADVVGKLHADLIEGRRDAVRVETRYRRKDGGFIWVDLAMSLIRHDTGRPRFTVTLVRDITERHEAQERLRFQALHDPLTGLANRSLFLERLGAALGPCRTGRVGLCSLDLDDFKAINDRLGHDVGDQLLVVIARRLAESMADRGHLLARTGGDSFVILVADSSGEDDLVAVAREALDVIAQPVDLDGQRLTVSASIGVVERPVAGTEPSDLIKAADATLHWAKSAGRGRWAVYDPVRRAQDKARTELVAALPPALARGEFVLEYQPIVALADEAVQGVEALVRWRHPELGLLSPSRFIGLAEETGFIVALGRWVLRRACADASRWHREFPDTRLMVSVNVAARQVHEPGFVAEVAETLEQTELPADLLQLELTERAVMATTGEPLRALRELAELGVRLAVDDFGTGYSSLAYLRRLPIHVLKLAAPFIEGIRPDDPAGAVDERIVDALVRLAHALGLSVTAEAVERAEQADRLRALGCDAGQGLLFGGAVEAAEISARLAAGKN